MIMCRSETASERLLRAQRTIKTMAVMLVVLLIASTIGTYSRNNTIKAQDAYIQALEARTSDLSAQVAELKGQVDAMQLQTVTQPVSRGAARTVTMELTGYCACAQCCGKTDGITASGVQAQDGVTIAADSRYAFGTEMVIPGVGVRTVQDRGGAIKGNRVDVYFESHTAALQFGRRTAEVQVK